MSKHPFSYLIDLVQCDKNVYSLKKSSKILEQEIVDLRLEKERLEQEIQTIQDKVISAKKNVATQELKMKEFDQQEQSKKIILANISDYKQYQLLKLEIDAIQKNQLAQEAIVLEAWNQLESAQTALEKKQQDGAVQIQKIIADLEKKEAKHAEIIAEIDDMRAERAEKEKLVPVEWVEKYDTIHARVPDPIVPVIGQACSACSQIITSSDLLRIRRGALMQCKGCFRLVYSPEIMDVYS